MNLLENALGGKKGVFFLIFLSVTGVLVLGSWWVISYVNSVATEEVADANLPVQSQYYVNFNTDEDQYISAGSYRTMAAYQQTYPEPRNVRILEGLTTQEINGHMMNFFVQGMRVNCTYCHNINNYAAGPEWEGEEIAEPTGEDAPHPEWVDNKGIARRHLELVQDLNRNWVSDDSLTALTSEKQPSGSQMSCAVCHNGVAQPEPWPADQLVLPDDFRLPLAEEFDLTAENAGILNVNANYDVSLDTVQYQQLVMYHMNQSMNVGCTHCHNSRYFPSREVPAIHYSQHMLEMTQYIWLNYADSMANKEPSCTMCHQGAILPPGAALSVDVLPAALVAEPSEELAAAPQDTD